MSRDFYNMDGATETGNGLYRHDLPPKSKESPHPPDPIVDEVFSRELRQAIARTRQFFFNHQHPDGHWIAELEGDSRFESETVLLLAFLGEENSEPARQCARYLLDSQKDDGGWGRFDGDDSEVDNTVKAYFALKLTGLDPTGDAMNRARIRALALGGADRLTGLSRFFLALLGQISYHDCPVVPSPITLFSQYFSAGIEAFSAGARPVIVPLSIVSALAPVRQLPVEKGIRELFVSTSDFDRQKKPGLFSRAAGIFRRSRSDSARQAGLEKAKQWILDRDRHGDGPETAFEPTVWTWIALKALGFEDDSEEIQSCRRQFQALVIRDDIRESVRIQPCRSPVRDTSLTLKAIIESGVATNHPAVRMGLQWIRDRRIHDRVQHCEDTATTLDILADRFDLAGTTLPKIANRGNLTPNNPAENGENAGNAENILPPDLRLVTGENAESLEEARQSVLEIVDATETLEDGFRRLLAMQCKDGGWAAFDCGNGSKKPYSDIDFVNDSSTPDVTGRVLATLGKLGFRVGQNAEADRAVEFLRRRQQPDGSWDGRWGVNYLYGIWSALTGLAAVGVPSSDPMMAAGVNWLVVHQHSSGAWGETPKSYENPSLRGHGTPTASQTAWAVMGLVAAGKTDEPAVHRGVRFLLDRQRHDGTWHESEVTGTAVPGRSYWKYHYYSVYFPMRALSMFAAKTKAANFDVGTEPTILRMEKIRLFSPERECYNNDRPEEFPTDEVPEPKPEKVRHRKNPPTLRLFLG